MGALVQICEWQFMQVLVGGMPAKPDTSTEVWQYRQSIPSPPTWCAWLKGTGCGRATPAKVVYGERSSCSAVHRPTATTTSEPKIVKREIVLVLRWNIWAIYRIRGTPPLPWRSRSAAAATADIIMLRNDVIVQRDTAHESQ